MDKYYLNKFRIKFSFIEFKVNKSFYILFNLMRKFKIFLLKVNIIFFLFKVNLKLLL